MLDCLLHKDFDRLKELSIVRADKELLEGEVGKL
jgi:hypothetical protein